MEESARAEMQRAIAALIPFVGAYRLPVNPEELEGMSYAVLRHARSTMSPPEIGESVQHQIEQAHPGIADYRTHVWIFHGDDARYASGVFTDRATALAWTERHTLTGVLTQYTVGDGCYDFAVRDGSFRPTKPHHGNPGHVGGFSPSRTEHIHVRHDSLRVVAVQPHRRDRGAAQLA